jgi:hypothetical protein
LLICATVVSVELQVTEASCSVLLSLKVPVAINRWVAPGDSVEVAGVIAIDSRFGGVRVPDSYSSALAKSSGS